MLQYIKNIYIINRNKKIDDRLKVRKILEKWNNNKKKLKNIEHTLYAFI